jgi:hypothetical protein
MPAATYNPADPWHSAVNLMLTVDCDTCHATFISPSLGLTLATGDEAAVVAAEAQAAGWQLIEICGFRCPSCCGEVPIHPPLGRTGG